MIQLAANALWTWLFFQWRLGGWAFAEIAVTVAPPAAREELIATLVTRGLDGVPPGSGECPAPLVTDPDAGPGTSPDAGPSTDRPDGGTSDGGTTDGPDVGDGPDSGRDPIVGTGCSCGTTRGGPGAGVLFLLMLTLIRRRRRAV